MSNVVIKGDVIQNLGEYLPNVYIESIEVTSTSPAPETVIFDLNVFYSVIFLISDDKDVSTTELLELVGHALRSHSPSRLRAWLFPFPIFIDFL